VSKSVDKTILVTDSHRGSALSILRALGRRGWRVIAASSEQHALGFCSRYAAETLVYPPPENAPQEFTEYLENAVKKYEIDLIIPVTDEVILPLAQNRIIFDGLCKIAMPNDRQLDLVTDKAKTLALAQANSVPIPKTRCISSLKEAEAVAREFQYPVVLKPLRSRLYDAQKGIKAFKVSYAYDAWDLIKQVSDYENLCDVLLQEYHPGEGLGVELLMWEGKAVAAFQHRRLHEVPITGGASSYRESVPLDPELFDYATRLLGALNWSGLAMVEFKRADDAVWLMEINGRVWGSLPLAVLSGMDFPNQLACLYLSENTVSQELNTNYRHAVRSRNLSLDIVWLLSVLRGKRPHPAIRIPSRWQLLPAGLGYLNPLIKTDVQSWDDPLPGLAEMPQIFHKLLRKLN
jgi:predicted ATP-grasp superfamily ATP-dependent carboligase